MDSVAILLNIQKNLFKEQMVRPWIVFGGRKLTMIRICVFDPGGMPPKPIEYIYPLLATT